MRKSSRPFIFESKFEKQTLRYSALFLIFNYNRKCFDKIAIYTLSIQMFLKKK